MRGYADYAGGYEEVSSNLHTGQQSPAPYATTTLIGSSKLGSSSDVQRYNMFYYPQTTSANGHYNRSVHSESFVNNKSNDDSNSTNIVENPMVTAMMNNYQHQKPVQNQQQYHSGSNKRNRLKLMKPQNIRNYFSNQGEQLYVKVGDVSQIGSGSNSSQQHTPQSNNGSVNIYENHMHNYKSDNENSPIYKGNHQSVMSYMSSKDFPENV